MSERPPLRVATVGTGYFSRFQYAAWDRIADAQLVAVCNRSREPAEELAQQYNIDRIYQDFDQMLAETQPDLVDIITPPATHDAYVRAAVKHGVTAICQKPFTDSLAEAEALVSFIEQHDATVIIHENFRFQPWYQKIKSLISDGEIGELYQIRYALRPGDGQGPTAYLDRQPYFQTMPRLLVHETAVHFVDVFRYLFGEVHSVYADLRRVNPVIAGEDAGVILFEFESGALGQFDGNRLSDHRANNRRLTMGTLSIEGSQGCITLNGDAEIHLRRHGENHEQSVPYAWTDRDFGGDCVYRLQQHVVDHLRHGTELMNSAQDYLVNLRLVDSCYRSNERGEKLIVAAH